MKIFSHFFKYNKRWKLWYKNDFNKIIRIINGKINTDKIIQGISSIIEISSNKSWRMRIQIMDDNPILAKIFDKNLLIEYFGICITY